ncbi:hypothetical protein, partial [Rhodococcus sp. BP-253]|uniref:hypothetical protein n=1 Tax=Rhodococcus sp. BP-253 TaxID=2739480 RepID=UPI001C9B0708
STRRGGVGATARTHLAEAERHFDAARHLEASEGAADAQAVAGSSPRVPPDRANDALGHSE